MQLTLKSLIKKRVEMEVLTSLKAAKAGGSNAKAHAQRQAQQTADNELRNIAYHATNPEYEMSLDEAECRLLTNKIQTELLKQNNRGVCCLSAEYDNPLLWSHYGDQHNGYCVGYSLSRNPKPIINEVVYGGVRTVMTSLIAQAVLNDDTDAQKKLIDNILLRKAEPWNYEKEWRILGSIGLQDSPLQLEEIVFGLRCPWGVMYSVIESLKSRNINFYQMYAVGDSFDLKRTSDLGEICSYFPRTSRSGIEIFGPADDQ